MKFLYADSIDTVDPNYDFIEERSKPGRKIYWDDQFPHEYLGTPPYDGLLVSRGIVGDHKFAGKYTQSQSMRFRRVGARKFLSESKFSKNSMNNINKKIKKAGLIKRSELIKGDIIKTSKTYIKKNRGFRISLLHLDLDTYEGTKHALKNFFPLVSKGGVVVFDEYGSRGWGESEAVDEYFHKTKYKIQKTLNAKKPTAYLVKK